MRRPRQPAPTAAAKPYDTGGFALAQLLGRRGPAPGVPAERRHRDERRQATLWSFLYGNLRPRRRQGRRRLDAHHVHLDWHEPGVLYLSLAIVLMSCADALFTLNILAAGGQELNGIMAALLGQSVSLFLGVKLALTGLSIVILAAVARRRMLGGLPVIWLLRGFFGGYALLIAWELYLLGWQATRSGAVAIEVLRRWAQG